jgi:uncharacterized protein YjbJ (UPF0337 family)
MFSAGVPGEAAMEWDRIAGNWAHWRDLVRERWGRLSNDELDVIAGRREHLVKRIQSAYGIAKDEADRQLRNWQRGLAESTGGRTDDHRKWNS